MITIKILDSAIEAHLLRSKLKSEGIPAYIFDENIMTLNPLYNNLVGGVKLKISQSDEEKARKILEDIENRPISNDDGKEILCPLCRSGKYYTHFKSIYSFKGIVAFLISFIFMVFPLYYESVKMCRNCGLEFR